jgi:hypothetical protein
MTTAIQCARSLLDQDSLAFDGEYEHQSPCNHGIEGPAEEEGIFNAVAFDGRVWELLSEA